MKLLEGKERPVLILNDEVNCKFDGLDSATRKELIKIMTVKIPHARFSKAYKMGRWDGTIKFINMGGKTSINLLPEILPALEKKGIEFDVVDNRREFDLCIPQISEDHFKDRKWPKKHPHAGEPIILRDYQCEAVNNFLAESSGLQEIATGAGKTLITAALSGLVEDAYPDDGRTIVIVPSKSLVRQTLDDYLNLGLDAGAYFGDRKELGKKHTISTWQSMGVLWNNGEDGGNERMADFIEGVTAVIVDECHQAKADVLKKMLTGPLANVPIRWGLTGTIPKLQHEQWSIRAGIGETMGKLAAKDLQDDGVLANCDINVFQLVDHIDHLKKYKDYHKQAEYLITTKERMSFVANLIDGIADYGNTLVLVDRIATGEMFMNSLPKNRSVLITGKMASDRRREHYDEVSDSDDRIMVATYGVASVGINLIRLHNLIMIEPGRSVVRVMQSIGRALRRGNGKDFARIFDICSTAKFSAKQLTERKKLYNEAKYPYVVTKVDWRGLDGEGLR